MTPIRLVANELKLLAENAQVWPRKQLQERLVKAYTELIKATKGAKK